MASLGPASLLLVGSLLTTLLSAQGPDYRSIADGCAGSLGVPLLEADRGGLPIFGDFFRTRLSNAADGPAIGIIGLNTANWAGYQLPLDLSPIGMPGCLLHTDIRYSLGLVVKNAETTWDIDIPNLPSWIGRSFYQQVLVFDPAANPAGAVLSNANEGTINVGTPWPLVKIVFPPAKSLTDETSIMVRGTAVDPDGVAEVRVNGELAETSDGFLNWRVRVPLDEVNNQLTVEAKDSLGNLDPSAAQVEVKAWPVMEGPKKLNLDETGRRILTHVSVDSFPGAYRIISYDPFSGDREVISTNENGSGTPIRSTNRLIREGNRLLSFGPFGIHEVDSLTGERRILADATTDWNVASVEDVFVVGNQAWIADSSQDAIVLVDLTLGSGFLVSHDGRGTGPVLRDPSGIIIDGNRALVTAGVHRAVLAIDLTTGERSLFSGPGVGNGPAIGSPQSLTMGEGRALMVDQLPPAVVAIDLVTGDRTVLSGHAAVDPLTQLPVGDGPQFERPLDIAAGPGFAMVSSESSGSTYAVDLSTGHRTEIKPPSSGMGPMIKRVRGVAQIADKAYLLAGDSNTGIYAVDLQKGDRQLLSGLGQGSGPALSNGRSIASDGSRLMVAIGPDSPALLAVDPATGDRQLLSGPGRGLGPEMGWEGLAVSPDWAVVAMVLACSWQTLRRGIESSWSNPAVQAVLVSGGICTSQSMGVESSGRLRIPPRPGNRSSSPSSLHHPL